MVAAHAAGGGNEVKQLGVVRAENAQRFVSGRWGARDGAIGDFTEIEHRSTIEQCSISVKRDAGHIWWWRVWALLRLQVRAVVRAVRLYDVPRQVYDAEVALCDARRQACDKPRRRVANGAARGLGVSLASSSNRRAAAAQTTEETS